MSKIAVLYFPAGNEVEIVSMVFNSIEDGLKKVKEITGKEMELDKKGIAYRINLFHFINDEEKKEEEGQEEDTRNINAKKFFTHYYGGCGEAATAILKEVEFGTPLFAFDLD